MIALVVGLILLAVPFLLMGLFSDKKRGFIYVLFFLLLFQTVLGLLTQALGIFYYGVVLACTLFADIILIFYCFKFREKFFFNFKNVDWVGVSVALISLLCLYQVHYNYTGKISSATDQTVSYHQVKNMVYPYPYFSDEWYAVSLVEGAINNHSLPTKNILNNGFFPNLELFFHSFIAEVMLILELNPLLYYTILSIFLNTLIILLIYLLLRLNKISKLSAGVCSLLALYITSGGNLPGLWQLIPFNLGIIFFLLSVCFMEIKDTKMTIASVILASLFYPPLIPFYFVGLLVFLLSLVKKRINTGAVFGILAIFPLAGTVKYIFSRIFFVSFMAPYIPQFNFFNIMPFAAIFLAIFGVYSLYKNKKWVLLSEFVLGVIFWLAYSFTVYRFFAEYERVVVLTSIIVVIISGFGIQHLEDFIKMKFNVNAGKVFKITEIAALMIFLLLAPFYTQQENWKKLISIEPVNKATLYPKSPANNYLTSDDLRIFKNIKNKSFLSLPWKGTTIGVATGNYPVLTKQGTISLGSDVMLNNFAKANCQNKENIAKKLNLDYIYLYRFSCLGFEKVGESAEGLVLYKVSLKN